MKHILPIVIMGVRHGMEGHGRRKIDMSGN